jgi:hypothetical protein
MFLIFLQIQMYAVFFGENLFAFLHRLPTYGLEYTVVQLKIDLKSTRM